jgi:biotin carboxylase
MTTTRKKTAAARKKKAAKPAGAAGAKGGRATVVAHNGRGLRGISDIRRFFIRNETPVYFVSATNFNLMGIDEWVRNFRFINYIDCFDGRHPNMFVPPELPHEPFTCLEDINNHLLAHPDVKQFIRSRGDGGKVVFLFFDEKTEELSRKLGLEVCFPKAALRREVDDKVSATRIADRAGVPSVPNVLARVSSYADLREKSRKLGDDLVIQTPFGDSGHTTFFISSEEDWDEHADEIVGEGEVKVMKRIRCRGSALEACVTRHGTIVGPLMTELIGFSELTPYRGGWCGNEVFADAFSREVRARARKLTVSFGEELRKM